VSFVVAATPGIAVSVVFSATPQPESETRVFKVSLARNNPGKSKKKKFRLQKEAAKIVASS